MTNLQLIVYLIGWAACMYVGMRVEAWRWGKRTEKDIQRAYDRGWKAGLNHLDRISVQKTELNSAMRILIGEEDFDDGSFAGSGSDEH